MQRAMTGEPGTTPRFHLRGTVLPSGEPRDLWIAEGRLVDGPVRDAVHLGDDEPWWILPGLVDAHCHIGLGTGGAVDRTTTEQQALTERAAGVLLVRDAGVPQDTRWIDDRRDLPRIVRCGRHIARARRYIRNYAVEVEPEDLVAEVGRQCAAGDGWVKVVGDWIDREVGDLAPLWPAEVVRQAVAEAHRHGARITTHVFGEEAVADWVAAGVDCVEHGTGLTDAVVAEMAARGTALDPTLVQIENFPIFAAQGQAKFPTYAKHMTDLHQRRFETVGKAIDAGVAIYAGSDAGGLRPHGTVADEIALLSRVGGAELAVGAASWRARDWLGRPSGLQPGEEADLVVFDRDPRLHPEVVAHPRHVILRGVAVVAARP